MKRMGTVLLRVVVVESYFTVARTMRILDLLLSDLIAIIYQECGYYTD